MAMCQRETVVVDDPNSNRTYVPFDNTKSLLYTRARHSALPVFTVVALTNQVANHTRYVKRRDK